MVYDRHFLKAAHRCLGAVAGAALMLFLAGCGEEEESHASERTEHPIGESIPYYDREHLSIDTDRSIEELEDAPDKIVFLADYLEEPERFEPETLDVFVNGARAFRAASVGEERLVFLDMREQRLLEYDVSAEEHAVLAEEGEGPGDIAFTQDMVREGMSVYVAGQNLRITHFDCASSPCQYEETTRLGKFSPMSIALKGDTFAVVGQTPMRDSIPSPETDAEVIRLVDEEGAVLDAFGSAYQSDVFLVRDRFLRGTVLHYLEAPGLYVLAYRYLPYLYVYDEQGELQASYEFDFFTQYVVISGHAPGRKEAVRNTDGDRSFISGIYAIDDHSILVSTSLMEVKGGAGDRDFIFRNDYYLVDLLGEESYHVGSDEYDGSHLKSISVTDAGLVVNDGGALSFVAY